MTLFGPERRLVWILAGKKVPLNSYRTRCQSDRGPGRAHTPLTEELRGLLLQGSVGGFSGLLCVCAGPKDGYCEFHGVQVSVPGKSCSTFAWNRAGCRTWTWAPGGSRPQCSHLYTLQGRQTRNSFINALEWYVSKAHLLEKVQDVNQNTRNIITSILFHCSKTFTTIYGMT